MNLRKDHYRFVLLLLDKIDISRDSATQVVSSSGATCVLLRSHGSGLADCVSAGVCPWLAWIVISPWRAVSFPFVSFLSTQTFLSENQIQHYTVDHLAQGSMKNGANSEMPCELQDTWTSTLWTHIAEISSSCFHTCFRVGLTSIKQLLALGWRFCAALSFTDRVSVSTLGNLCPGLNIWSLLGGATPCWML